MQNGIIKISRFTEGLTVFKPDYYLNPGKKVISDLIDKGIKYDTLQNISDNIYQGGIFKRVFVDCQDPSFKYVTASDMLKARPLETANDISKKFTPWIEEMTLRKDQILVSCAGTVGNAVLVDDSFSGCIGSQEIIRVEVSKIPNGYVYAYLKTPLVYDYIQSMIYGAVVPRISPIELGRLPILIASEPTIIKINNLIQQASKLREKGNKLLSEVHYWFDKKLNFENRQKISSFKNFSSIKFNYHNRLDSSHYLNIASPSIELAKPEYNSRKLGELVSHKMFTAQRGKRNYVNSNGIRFLSTTNISERNPLLVNKYLSKKTSGLNTLIVKKKWILISSSGQDILGSAFFVDDTYSDSAVNQHSIRVIIDEKIVSPFYVYAYLSTPKIKHYIRSGIYGSAVLTIDENFLKDLEVPFFSINDREKISTMTEEAINSLEQASFKEKEAIELVENEIESWQKS